MTSQASRIRWNTLFAFLSQLIRLLTNFFLFVGIARFYGPEAFGRFTTAHTLSTMFLLFADFGFDTLLSTEIARQRHRATELAQKYFSFKLLFAVCATLAMIAFLFIGSFTPETKLLVEIFSFYVLFSSLNNFFFALFKGYEQFQHETRISFGINLSLLILLIVLGIAHVPLTTIAICFVGSRIAGLAVGARVAFRLTTFNLLKIDLSGWREVWRHVSIFGIHSIFGNLFFTLDTILLALWRGDYDVGMYQSVFKIVLLSLIIPDIIITTMMPVLSRIHAENEERWNSLGCLLKKTLLLFGLPVSMIMFIYAEQIIQIVYGKDRFVEAIPILRIFACTVLVRFAVETYALMLTTSRRQTTRAIIVIAGTGGNLILNILMIPKFGPIGAAGVSLITNILVGIGYFLGAKHSLVNWKLDKRSFFPLITTACLILISWKFRMWPIWYTCPVIVSIYALVLYVIGFTKEEWATITSQRKQSLVLSTGK